MSTKASLVLAIILTLPASGVMAQGPKAHLPELSEPCKEALFQAWLRQ